VTGRTRAWLVAGAALAAGAVLFARDGGGQKKSEIRPESKPETSTPRPAETPVPAPARPAYVGSQTCRECHEKNYQSWSKSWHARALAKASASAMVGSWNGVHFKGESSEAWMQRKGGDYSVRTRDREGGLGDYPVSWVIGGKRMQDPLTVLDDGRWQVLPIYFHVTGRGAWVDYNEARQGKVGPDHPFFWTNLRRTANHECLDCHVTGLDVKIDRGRWSTEFVDAGVACESCHGPGAKHAESMEPGDIVQPRKIDGERGLAICGSCHGPRDPVFPLLDAAHRFQPGRRYDEGYDVYMIATGRTRSSDFFADGRPKSGSFEYQALLQSACYRKGKATCLSCHTAPHAPRGEDELAEAPGDRTPLVDQGCRGCHAPVFAAGREHTRHRAAAAQSCAACHMPRLVPAVLDLEADHSIDVPVPENSEKHGVPNACGVCHRKDAPAKLAADLHRMWPDAAARQARRIRLADAFDPEHAEKAPDALAEVLADGGEAPSLRGAAILILAQIDPQRAVRALPSLMQARDATLRARAATAAGMMGLRDARPALVALAGDRSLLVRLAAVTALAATEAPEAESELRRLTRDPATEALPDPHLHLALLLGRRGDFDSATRELERALALRSYSVATMLALSDAYIELGRTDDARAILEQALGYEPGSEGARARLEHLAGMR
jgi:HEAT repeat protein